MMRRDGQTTTTAWILTRQAEASSPLTLPCGEAVQGASGQQRHSERQARPKGDAVSCPLSQV